ncbi:cysteine proteinase, partial [Decorospora gaudefroyi]
ETGAKTEVPEIQEQTQQQAMSSKRLANSATDIISPVKEEATDTTMDGLSPMTPPETTSPKTRKRGHPSPTPDSEPSNKKCKETPFSPSQNGNLVAPPPTFPSPPGMPATVHDKATWQGFCDIESEPAYFSVLLREMGVQDVTVREVFSMDHDFILANIPQPIYGFILLFHYREFGNDDQPAECPPDVWFANQLPAQNSCATLAMINILMNQSASSTADGVQIGEHLAQFKDFTTDMTPYQRGEALASFDFVKRIHNSFAKKMDILEADKHLSSKVKRATSQHKPSKNAPGTKSRRRRAVSTASATSASSSESVQENAHHYIAFVPCGTQIYKLDGLDKQPTCMGPFDPIRGETWLQ